MAKGRVLDIGCGAGRHSLRLQNKGLDVIARAIKVAKLRGMKNARIMSLEDMSFKPNSFDTVLMLGGNFALVSKRATVESQNQIP